MVIAGAGIIGLSAALELARRGLSVIVLEQGASMREASWAAAGMLAAHDPENPRALDALAALSLSLYPVFLADVARLSRLPVPLRTAFTWQGSHAHAGQLVEPAPGLVAELPDLRPGTRAFTRLDEESLDPRDLCRALPLAVAAAGVRVIEHTRVDQLRSSPGAVEVRTSSGEFTASAYLHCCGAWSSLLPGHGPPAATIPVEPRKGQMVSTMMPAAGPQLACVVRTPELYLVPRGDGLVVVGATVERVGFDRSISTAATNTLLDAAAELWPPIRTGRVVERWCGLRPATPDALPILDAVAPRAWIGAGHYRNGILLAPGTARVLAELVLGKAPQIDLSPFRLDRFDAERSGLQGPLVTSVSALRYN